MKNKILAILGVFLVVFSAVALAQGPGQRYLVKSQSSALRAVAGVQHEFAQGFTADLSTGQVAVLQSLGVEVEAIPLLQPLDQPTHAAERRPSGGGGRTATPSDQTPYGIEMVYNDPLVTVTTGGAGVDVAVLDTGVNRNHVDLSRRVAQCKDFTRSGVRDGCSDSVGHGTHVAGTILADGGADGLGIYGMAPQANLLAYKVCGNAGCWSDDIAEAIRFATDNGAEIISMSLGSDGESTLIRDAISYAVANNVLVVAAAGNDGPALGSIDWPGANPDVVAVAALDSSRNVADWSSRGLNDGDYIIEAQEVELAAPGVNVESTWNDGGYRIISGTSMATPHVSGLAAKSWQGSGALTRVWLQAHAVDVAALGDDPATGFGLPLAA